MWTLIVACVALTVMGGAAAPASAMASVPVLAHAADTTIDAKYQAAAVLGWVPREEVTLSDRDFVTVLWEKASEKHNPEVKAAALAAFSDPTDAEAASARFIEVGIFQANDRDVALKARKAELDAIRLRAAQEINWVPVNNTERSTMLDQTLQNFTQAFWRRAATWPLVKAAVEPLTAADATDDQRLDFLQHALFEKAETDRQNEIADGNAEEVAAREAAALRSAKEKAIAAGLKRSATPYELDELEERELIHLFATDSTGRRVKADATVAYANSSPDVWRAFIFSGVHLANKVDLDERDLAEARANEVEVRDIMYAAEADGYQPTVVTTAKKALEVPALDRSLFLLGGHDAARQADFIRPAANRNVMIQAVGYNGCIAKPNPWLNLYLNNKDINARVDPCNENNVSQRWILTPDATAGRYKIMNESGVCLFPAPARISQDGAPITSSPCYNRASAAIVWELLDSGQGNVEIRNVTNNKVVTAVAGATAGALTMVQNPNGHTTAQQWRLIDPSHQAAVSKSPTGSFRIKGVQSGRCVRPAGALTTPGAGAFADGAPMELRDCGSGTEQIWDVTTLSDTRFELRNRASQFCLAFYVFQINFVNSSVTEQWTCGSKYASWSVMFHKSTGGYLRQTASGAYLSARDKGTANGAGLAVNDYASTADEQWVLEPVSAASTDPAPIWTSSGRPLTSFSGTAVTFQPQCAAAGIALNNAQLSPVRADVANVKKGLIRADILPGNTTNTNFQFCVVAAPSSSTLEVTMKNVGANAYVREATNVTPSGVLIADQKVAANAERFIFQQRRAASASSLNSLIDVLQSKTTKKYAMVDTTATGTNAKALRFMGAAPTAATELSIQPEYQ